MTPFQQATIPPSEIEAVVQGVLRKWRDGNPRILELFDGSAEQVEIAIRQVVGLEMSNTGREHQFLKE